MSSKLLIFIFILFINFILILFKIKILFQFLKIDKIWKINFLLPVGFEPTTSGFRDQRLNH